MRTQSAVVDLSTLPLADNVTVHLLVVQSASDVSPSILVTVPRNATEQCFGTCDDGVRNGAEIGVDCGGNCAACPSTTTTTARPTPLPTPLPPGDTLPPGFTGATDVVFDSSAMQSTRSGQTAARESNDSNATVTNDDVQGGQRADSSTVLVPALAGSLGFVCCVLCVIALIVLLRRRRNAENGQQSNTTHVNDQMEMHTARASGFARESSIDQQYGSTGLIAAQQRNTANDTVNSASTDHYSPMAMHGGGQAPTDDHSTYGTLQISPQPAVEVGMYASAPPIDTYTAPGAHY